MHTRISLVIATAATLLLPIHVGAADKTSKVLIAQGDSIMTVLEKQNGQSVKLRLKSGTEISGKVAYVGKGLVQIAEISGMEFFDAVIDIADISAVLIRVRKR